MINLDILLIILIFICLLQLSIIIGLCTYINSNNEEAKYKNTKMSDLNLI